MIEFPLSAREYNHHLLWRFSNTPVAGLAETIATMANKAKVEERNILRLKSIEQKWWEEVVKENWGVLEVTAEGVEQFILARSRMAVCRKFIQTDRRWW
jgi:hypothetical protein